MTLGQDARRRLRNGERRVRGSGYKMTLDPEDDLGHDQLFFLVLSENPICRV